MFTPHVRLSGMRCQADCFISWVRSIHVILIKWHSVRWGVIYRIRKYRKGLPQFLAALPLPCLIMIIACIVVILTGRSGWIGLRSMWDRRNALPLRCSRLHDMTMIVNLWVLYISGWFLRYVTLKLHPSHKVYYTHGCMDHPIHSYMKMRL